MKPGHRCLIWKLSFSLHQSGQLILYKNAFNKTCRVSNSAFKTLVILYLINFVTFKAACLNKLENPCAHCIHEEFIYS